MSIETRVLTTYVKVQNKFELSKEFEHRLTDWSKFFQQRLLNTVSNIIGNEDWYLRFIETPDKSFMVDIKVPHENNYLYLAEIVARIIPEIKFSFYKFDYVNGHVRIK